jgi:Fe-S-cluster-containing dehydrogenase component/DMSO reductase anchor subunit
MEIMTKNVFIFDQNKCVGCHACVVACINENGFQSPDQWRNVHKSNNPHLPQLPLIYLSLACNHCDDAPCLKNCPSLAYSRDEITGAVIHNPDKCIGCKYCTWACPYDAPKFNPKSGIIEKCTFCNHRIEEDLKPACANSCPVGALDFKNIEFGREESVNSSPVPVNAGSNLKTIKLRKETGPEMDLELFKAQSELIPKEKKQQKISALKEWPLIAFTLLTTGLVSLYASGITNLFNSTHKLIYTAITVFTAILSMLHLGKKLRMWRSIINIKNSWLSREICFFALFFASVFCEFYFFDLPDLLPVSLGLFYLFSVDMLYRLATWKWLLKIHSAQTILIGISLFAFFTGWYYLFVFIISFRLTIYFYRKFAIIKNDLMISAIRIILPIISIALLYNSQHHILSLILFALGEVIDRIEFYTELNVPDPKVEFESQNK